MKSFIARIFAFFAAFMTRSDEQKDRSLEIIAQLKRQKALNVDVAESVGSLEGAANDLYGQMNTVNNKLDGLEKRKTNVDEVFYNYGDDLSPYKPVADDANPVQASVLFDHVMAKLNKLVVNDTVVHILLSGDVAIPMLVDGVKQSGAPLEKLQAVIAVDGTRTYQFASSTTDEAMEAMAKKAEEAKLSMEASQQDYDGMKVDMKDLLSTPMPTAKVKIVKA